MSLNKKRRGTISITFMSGPYDGKQLEFEQPDIGEQKIIAIGRRDGCDVQIDHDSQISRVHARLGCASIPVTGSDSTPNPFILTFWLEDDNSRNGTFLDKSPERLIGRVTLRPGTLFRVGRTWLRLDIPLSF